MKNLYLKKTKALLQLFMLTMMLFAFKANAQCPSGDITLNTQAEVDQFIIDYPNCTEMAGQLFIGVSAGSSDIIDLNPLSNLTSVDFLAIWNNIKLTSLSPLSNLSQIGGQLSIQGNSQLTNIDGLNNITNVGGDLRIQLNQSLVNIDGLSNVKSVGRQLRISKNDLLTSLGTGLSNLVNVGYFVQVDNNPVLSNISALRNIANFGSNGLEIKNNPALAVCNLPNFCNYLSGTGVREVSGNLAECVSEAAVVAACAASQCPEGDVELKIQAQIDQFIIDYPNCTQITGDFQIGSYIEDVPSDITDLSPLSNITNVTEDLFIQNNGVLKSLDGLNISIVGGRVFLAGETASNGNSQLADINALSSLTKIGKELSIRNNPLLTNLDALSNLISIGGNLVIGECEALTHIDGLNGLTSIGGYLSFISNPSLLNLNGLNNLISIENDIYIEGNAVLSDISALKNTTFVPVPEDNFGLTIIDNPALAVCNLPNFCTYLANPASTHPREISGNLAECVNEEAVVAACAIMSVEGATFSNIAVYPNPANEMLYFSEEVFNVKITDLSGGIVEPFSAEGTSLNVSNLSKGVYLLSAITQDGRILTQKIIKE
jgi:hypothetical protein